MQSAGALAYLLLLARVAVLGFERPAFKALGRERDALAATAIAYSLALVLLLPLLLIWPAATHSTGHAPGEWLPYAIASGLVSIAGYTLYTSALSRGEVSLLSPIYSTGLIWLYLIDILYGSAHFGWQSAGGVLLVTAGLMLLNGQGQQGWQRFNLLRLLAHPGAWQMLVCAFALAITRVIDHNASGLAPAVSYAAVATLPTVLFCLGLLLFQRRLGLVSALLRERPLASFGAATTHISGYLILLAALRFFNASLIEPVAQLSLLVSVGLGALWFREQVGRRWLPVSLVIAGSALLLWK